MAWRDGRLVFDGESLQQVLDEFSRYTADRFEIPDSSLRAIRIGGYFPAGDTQTLQSILESGFGLVLKRQPTGALRVDRARREPARKTPN
jgi:transmembrane sensor